jgi:hypothetical protein
MNFGTTAGNVRVQAVNACASGTTVQKAVSFNCRTEEEVNEIQEQVELWRQHRPRVAFCALIPIR